MESNSIGRTSKHTGQGNNDNLQRADPRNIDTVLAPNKEADAVLIDFDGDVVRDEITKESNEHHATRPQFEHLTLDDIDKNEKPMILSKHEPTYKLETFEKRALIIFNHKYFISKRGDDAKQRKKTRLGTEHDVKALDETFKKLGFDVVEHQDLTKDEVFKELETFSKTDFSNYGCIAVAVLTHGKEDRLIAKDNKFYSEVDILQYLNVTDKPTLLTKPRIIIVQACRGKDPIDGVQVIPAKRIQADSDSDDGEDYYLPKESDILILHSSYRGKPSYRDTLEGSWFIQSLCKKLNELAATHDLESIITEVKREVAVVKQHQEMNDTTLRLETRKQMPVVTSTLIRKLYLRKYENAAQSLKWPDSLTSTPNKSLSDAVFDISTLNKSLRPNIGQSSSVLYSLNCLRLTDWMSTAENYLQSTERSEEEIKILNQELQEFRRVLDIINLSGAQLKASAGDDTIHVENIIARYNKRFDAITGCVQALDKKNTRDVDQKYENISSTSEIEQEEQIFVRDFQELVRKIVNSSSYYTKRAEIQTEMKKLLSWLQDTSDWINKFVIAGDLKTLQIQQAKLKSIMLDLETYASSISRLNVFTRHVLPSGRVTKESVKIKKIFDTVNAKWSKLKKEARDRQKDIEEAVEMRFHAELDELINRLGKVEENITTPDPIGVAGPENASGSKALSRFKEIYSEVMTVDRPRVEAVLHQNQVYVNNNVLSQESKVILLKNRWDYLLTNAPDMQRKLELAVNKAEELKEALQSFCDWLTRAERILESVKPASAVAENLLLVQIGEHKLLELEVQSRSETLLQLDQNTYFLHKQDMIEFRKLLSAVQSRFDNFDKAVNSTSMLLNNRLKELNKFKNVLNNLMNWLSGAEKHLDNIESNNASVKESIQERMLKSLEAKKKEFDQVMKNVRNFIKKSPNDEPFHVMLSDLEIKWNLVKSKATNRADRKHLTELWAVMEVLQDHKREMFNAPVCGDHRTVLALIKQHEVYNDELSICEPRIRDLLKKINESDTEEGAEDIRLHSKSLMDLWTNVISICKSKREQLQNALDESEDVENRVQKLLRWLIRTQYELKSANQETRQQITKQLKEKQQDKNDTVTLARSLLYKAHPDAKAVIDQWITQIQKEWNEVEQLAIQSGEVKTLLKVVVDEPIPEGAKRVADINVSSFENDDKYKLSDKSKVVANEAVSPAMQQDWEPKETFAKSPNGPPDTEVVSTSQVRCAEPFNKWASEAHIISDTTATLDRDAIQKKTFSKWINTHLATVNCQVNDVLKDLRDGNNLISLLEVLSGEHLPRERGRMRFHMLQNVQMARDFLRYKNIKLVNIRAEDIVDGNPKLTLGLIWTIILHFQLSTKMKDGSNLTPQKLLLNWVRQNIEKYPRVNVTNFTTSWRDGLAFCALIHRHLPDLIDWHNNIMTITVHKRLETAFNVAEKCGVARLLDPEDVNTEEPDDKSLITYIALLFEKLPHPTAKHPLFDTEL